MVSNTNLSHELTTGATGRTGALQIGTDGDSFELSMILT